VQGICWNPTRMDRGVFWRRVATQLAISVVRKPKCWWDWYHFNYRMDESNHRSHCINHFDLWVSSGPDNLPPVLSSLTY
jgi:hypothetical protein